MKDLRPYSETQEFVNPALVKVEEQRKVKFLATKEFFFNLKKNFLKNIWIYLLILSTFLLLRYPAPVGSAMGKWIKEFVNAFTEQVYQIKKRPS